MSVTAAIYLIIKLLVLGLVYFGIVWLDRLLGIGIPDTIMKILAVILGLIGVAMILNFIGVF